jgi:hypothetical protein
MSDKINYPTSLLQFGGLKVSLQSALSDALDSITQRRKYTSQLIVSTTRTAQNTYDLTGYQGFTQLQFYINITALTLNAGAEIYFLIQHRLPDAVTYDLLINHRPTATESKIINLYSTGGAAVRDRSLVGGAYETAYPTMWGDNLRVHLFDNSTGTYSVTFSLYVAGIA